METVKLVIPSQPEYVITLRLVTASLARRMNFDYEAVEDLRVCVSELVNYLLPFNDELKVIFYEEEDYLKICIKANIQGEGSPAAEMSRMILESLMNEVSHSEGEIYLIKYR